MSTNLVNTNFKNIQTSPVLKQSVNLVTLPTVQSATALTYTPIPGSYGQGTTISDIILPGLDVQLGTNVVLYASAYGLTGPSPGTTYVIGTLARWNISAAANNFIAYKQALLGVPLPQDCWLGLYALTLIGSYSPTATANAIVSYANLQ